LISINLLREMAGHDGGITGPNQGIEDVATSCRRIGGNAFGSEGLPTGRHPGYVADMQLDLMAAFAASGKDPRLSCSRRGIYT
jgi:hypothetical protein